MAGPRPRPKAPHKNKISLWEKCPTFLWLNAQIFIKLYIIFKILFIFFISDVKDTINFTVDLQIFMLLITKK